MKHNFGTLILKNKSNDPRERDFFCSKIRGRSFGYEAGTAGEVVFSTGMVGYPESLTDPSYCGQILVLTYPLIGNYGVPDKKYWESDKIQVKGLIVNQYIETPSHWQSKMTLSAWLKQEKIPALEIPDTRALTQKIRETGTILGKIEFDQELDFYNPDEENLVAKVSTKKNYSVGSGKKTVALIDCGVKQNIIRSLIGRGVRVEVLPWDEPIDKKYDGVVISNGPGDPKQVKATVTTVKKLFDRNIPILGICLGNQILALAGGGDTYKLKFGHRGQNQPCRLKGTNKCYLTTQNHGFSVGRMPVGFKPWFININDHTNEGIIHQSKPWLAVQFHPEACPGPTDTGWIFDEFIKKL
jgi:carbamoyl-phosphate synthase small subunit